MVSPDLSQYLGVFLDEGNEQIDLLEQHLLEIERLQPTTEMLQAMFRAAHTLKGSSRTMGFMRVGDLTHEMENVLDDVRNHQLGIDTEGCNVLLECLDLLKRMMAEIQQHGTDEGFGREPVEILVRKLNHFRANAGTASPTESAKPTSVPGAWTAEALARAAQEAGDEQKVWQVAVTLRSGCQLKSVRVLMVLSALREQASIIATIPTESEIESENFSDEFSLLVASDLEADSLRQVVGGISEIDSVVVASPEASTPGAGPTPTKPEPKSADSVSESPTTTAAPSTGTIRVAVSRLDSLLNLVGELVIDRSQINRIAQNLEDKLGQTELVGQLNEATHRIARITGELQDQIMKTRLLPIDGVFQRMPRMVRDLAQKTGKEIDFQISGGDTELDRSLLDILSDPIIHLLRNCLDHGVEGPDERLAAGKSRVGKVTLSARQEENHIVIEISDDGRGIDPNKLRAVAVKRELLTSAQAEALSDHEAIKLIFMSGLSTAKQLSDISGRGVGMDIVKSNIEKIGGRIHLESQLGKGTRFLVHLPLTLAIVRALLVNAGTATFAVPLASVVETVRLGTNNNNFTQEKMSGRAVLVLRGETVPLANLLLVLDGDPDATLPENISQDDYVVVIGYAEKKVGLCVENLAGEQEVVIKSLGKLLGDVPGLAGASILGDGRVALIVDAARAVNL